MALRPLELTTRRLTAVLLLCLVPLVFLSVGCGGNEFGAAHGLVILASRSTLVSVFGGGGIGSGSSGVRLRSCGLVLGLATILALCLTLPSRAEALVYWVNNDEGTIGRANLDGSAVDQSFIAVALPLSPSIGLAVNDRHIFWAGDTGFIGRANLDGSGVDPDYIALNPGGENTLALGDAHVYWASDDWIGRANLDGTGVNQQLLAPQSNNVRGLAVGGNNVYWADYQNSRIGNSDLGTLGVNPLFIQPTADRPEGLAVSDSHVYWSNGSANTIGRAKLDGTAIDQSFIPTSYAYGVALEGSHVFWADYDINAIGRANLDGSGIDPAFIGGASGPEGLALDWIVNTGAGLRIVKVKRNRGKGTAKLTVSVPGPGKLSLVGKGLKRVQKGATQAQVRLLARPTGALKRKLAAKGKAKTKARVSFRPKLSTDSKTKAKRLSLRKRR